MTPALETEQVLAVLAMLGIRRTEVTAEMLANVPRLIAYIRRSTMTKQELADAIVGMSYSDLSEIGRELHDMTQSEDGKTIWDLSDHRQWSEMLYSWAQAQEGAPRAFTKAA